MNTVDDHPVKVEQISTGLSVLNKRQTKMSLMGLLTGSLFVISFVGLFFQQDFIYSFFGLTQTVEQLHLPFTLDSIVEEYNNQPDYFFNLLGWIGWFILKVFVSIIGAFVAIKLLRRFRFFAVRFQSFVLKFVAWLISLIVIWSGLTVIQYDLRNDDVEDQYELVHYQSHIQESQIANILNESNVNDATKAYVLAQTALLHRPVDKDVATSYVAQLVQAERTQNNFIENGFKPEQIWTLQNEVYGQAVSPIAKSMLPKVQKADQLAQIVQIVLIALAGFLLVMTLLFYTVSRRLKGRATRIQQQLES